MTLEQLLATFDDSCRYAKDCSYGKAGTVKGSLVRIIDVSGLTGKDFSTVIIPQKNWPKYDKYKVVKQRLYIRRGSGWGDGWLTIYIES